MLYAIRRLWTDKRGSVIAIVAAGLPLVMGSAALAVDTMQWVTWKRELQRAADTAAYSGVYAKAQGASVSTAVNRSLSDHNAPPMGLVSGYPQLAYPTSANYSGAVQVTLAVQRRLPFTSMFMSTPPTITATATAAMTDQGNFCVVALDSGTTSSITIGGNAHADLGCGVISNSTSSTAAIGTNGNSYDLIASPVAGAGGLPSSIRGASNLQPFHVAMPDPYAGKYSTDLPAGMTCKANVGAGTVNGVVQPGCYNNFNPGNGTTTLAAGTYYLNNTGLSINGNTTITGTGVTLIFTGTAPGSLSMNGNSVLNLTAPTTGDFAKMLMIQSNAATAANSNTINGNNGAKLDGAMYFPKGTMNFTGNSSPATKCAMIVAYRVDFGGSTDIQNNTTGCAANSTVSGKVTRLVA